MQLTPTHVYILDPKSKALADAERTFVQERYQQLITNILTSFHQRFDLFFGKRLRSPLGNALLQQILFNQLPFGEMMQETFVRTGMSRKIGAGPLVHVCCEVVLPPQVFVEASDRRNDLIDGSIGTGLHHRLGWKHLERMIGIFEPQDETSEIVERDLLVIEVLLDEIGKKERKTEGVGA